MRTDAEVLPSLEVAGAAIGMPLIDKLEDLLGHSWQVKESLALISVIFQSLLSVSSWFRTVLLQISEYRKLRRAESTKVGDFCPFQSIIETTKILVWRLQVSDCFQLCQYSPRIVLVALAAGIAWSREGLFYILAWIFQIWWQYLVFIPLGDQDLEVRELRNF